MSFAQKVKTEIISKPIKDDHCKIAFLSGVMRGSGVLFERDGELGVDFRIGTEQGAEFVSLLLKSLFNYDVREISVSENNLSKNDRFEISVTGKEAITILKTLGILTGDDDQLTVDFDFYGKICKKDCCLRSFFKGLFYASGNCTVPKQGKSSSNTGYHLEFTFSHVASAQATADKLSQIGLSPKVTSRKGKYVVYIKSAEEIKDFIAFLPAPVSVLSIIDLMINKEIANNSNRQKNCDLGNLNRQVTASINQINAINKIEKSVGLKTLKDDLKTVALARKSNPDQTLVELADELGISKSCLNHRLRKIVEIANDIKG